MVDTIRGDSKAYGSPSEKVKGEARIRPKMVAVPPPPSPGVSIKRSHRVYTTWCNDPSIKDASSSQAMA